MKFIGKIQNLFLKTMKRMTLKMAHLKFPVTISFPTSSDEKLKMRVMRVFKMWKKCTYCTYMYFHSNLKFKLHLTEFFYVNIFKLECATFLNF